VVFQGGFAWFQDHSKFHDYMLIHGPFRLFG